MAAAVPDYKVDDAFGEGKLKSTPLSIAVTPQDQIHVLLSGGTVVGFDATGKATGEFSSEMAQPATAMALANGKIYLLSTESKDEQVEFQGKKSTRKVANGVKCAVFSATGTKEAEFPLPGMLAATDAHFIGDQLAVGDYRQSQIAFFKIAGDKATQVKAITGEFRLCCGIFDFCPTADGNDMFVANLGAFKVQTYSNRRKSDEFGARGEKLEEFHGCCNPVNVAALGNSFIVTVEKAPTRVKICDRKGKQAKIIDGVGELVAGCSTIPVAIDSKGAIYLASATRNCLVKCVSDAPPSDFASAPAVAATPSKSGYRELSEARVWQDAQSRKQVTGKLLAFDGTASTPTLERDGKVRLLVGKTTFELPLTRLIQSDQDFVAEIRNKLAPAGSK